MRRGALSPGDVRVDPEGGVYLLLELNGAGTRFKALVLDPDLSDGESAGDVVPIVWRWLAARTRPL